MIKLPKMYTANSIKAMHEKLNLDAQTVMLLYDYFDAFSNFYEMLPLKDAYKIIKKQNDELKLTEEDFIAFSEIARQRSISILYSAVKRRTRTEKRVSRWKEQS